MSGGVPAGELLPCPNPWCASHRRSETREAYAPYVKLFTGGYYRVTCAVCPQIGPSKRESDDAITAWNTRATPTPPIEGRDADVEGEAEKIATQVADRCQGNRKPGQSPQRYAIIWQAARLGALQAFGERR